jgi:hypothetical protein
MLHSQVFHQILYFPSEKKSEKKLYIYIYTHTHTHTYEEKCDMSENNIISVELLLGTPEKFSSSFQCGACPEMPFALRGWQWNQCPAVHRLGWMDGGGWIGNTSSFKSNSLT